MFPLILMLDASGYPRRWITYEDAVTYSVKDLIAWEGGGDTLTIHGGICRMTGEQSCLRVNTIIAVRGKICTTELSKTPTLTNRLLFRRDGNQCAYCGEHFAHFNLTRDHIIPKSKGGKDTWGNVVTSCMACNHAKDDRTPTEAGMQLLYEPHTPTKAESLLLSNYHILPSQREFLTSVIDRNKY